MAHKKRPANRKAARLQKADRLLEQVWDSLDPGDITADRWEDLRKLILAVKAARKRA